MAAFEAGVDAISATNEDVVVCIISDSVRFVSICYDIIKKRVRNLLADFLRTANIKSSKEEKWMTHGKQI